MSLHLRLYPIHSYGEPLPTCLFYRLRDFLEEEFRHSSPITFLPALSSRGGGLWLVYRLTLYTLDSLWSAWDDLRDTGIRDIAQWNSDSDLATLMESIGRHSL